MIIFSQIFAAQTLFKTYAKNGAKVADFLKLGLDILKKLPYTYGQILKVLEGILEAANYLGHEIVVLEDLLD